MSEFDKYIVQGEPDKKAKANAWQTAIGLQDVDGLKPSEYLIKTAVQHIEGGITIGQVKDMLDTYYETKDVREHLDDERTEEADKVSARITEILSEQSFSFTPDYLLRIHRRLFEHRGCCACRYQEHLANYQLPIATYNQPSRILVTALRNRRKDL